MILSRSCLEVQVMISIDHLVTKAIFIILAYTKLKPKAYYTTKSEKIVLV